MTPTEFRAIRLKLGLSQQDWGRALGYQGDSIRQHVNKMEAGHPKAPIRETVARLAEMYGRYGIPADLAE